MDSKTFLLSTNSQDAGDNNIEIKPEQIAAVASRKPTFSKCVYMKTKVLLAI